MSVWTQALKDAGQITAVGGATFAAGLGGIKLIDSLRNKEKKLLMLEDDMEELSFVKLSDDKKAAYKSKLEAFMALTPEERKARFQAKLR